MRKEDVLKLPSMPAAGPSYPAGPYRFVDREYMVITYETDPEIIHAAIAGAIGADRPSARSLRMDQDAGQFWLRRLHRIRHGHPVPVSRQDVNFVAQMYLDDDPPIAAGREIWGFPKKYAHPET